MKIAYVYDAVYPFIKGGAEKRIYEIASRLARDGHDVHWYGVKWWDGGSIRELDGIVLHGVCRVKSLYTGDGRRSIGEAFKYGFRVFSPLLKEKHDIIDVGNFPYFSCFFSSLASRMKDSSMVITWHEVWGDYWYKYLGLMGYFGKIVEKRVARLSVSHVAVSEFTRRKLVSVGAENVRVIPNGIDFKVIQAVSPVAEECDVLFVGRLIREKNVDVLLRAISNIRKNFPDIKCRVIGDGPERDRLLALSEELGLGNNVEFLGFLSFDEVIANIKASKVFVLPSSREGFGIVLLEAMACGTPVVAVKSERSAASDIITKDTGVLCELENLNESILRVLDDQSLREKIIGNGYEYSKRFDWENIVKETQKLYEEITK